jgi:hypothetical protein
MAAATFDPDFQIDDRRCRRQAPTQDGRHPLHARPMTDEGPSFGLALVAVLAGGAISSWFSALFVGFAPFLSHTAWTVFTSVFGAYATKLVLQLLGYEIGIVAAFGALFLGSVVSLVFLTAMPQAAAGPGIPLLPAAGLLTGLPGLLLSAFLIQNLTRSGNEATFR